MRAWIAFYTKVLDFELVDGDADEDDPSFAVLAREGAPLFLSSHRGDRTFGQAIVVSTGEVDNLFRRLLERGLVTPGNPNAPTAVDEGLLDQRWGTFGRLTCG